MGKINVKKSILEIVEKNNLEILKIDLINDDESFVRIYGEERGVSVYEAHKNINGTYSPVLPFPTNEMAFNSFITNVAYSTSNKYLVTGDLLDETGTDGEPLIKNVKILKKL